MLITIKSVNISEKKGTVKHPVPSILLDEKGVTEDAHRGDWHRQVSMLAMESICKFEKEKKRMITYGEFAENITTEGLLLYKVKPLDRFVGKEVELEVTQIGKHCHGAGCAIFNEVGTCVMPKEGIFCRVVKGGSLKAGDGLEYVPRTWNINVITVSDRAYAGVYEDKSGEAVTDLLFDFLESQGIDFHIEKSIVPDEIDEIRKAVLAAIHDNKADFVFTTGGTGVGMRDVTPEALRTLPIKEVTGIMENIRLKYGTENPKALLSRSICGTIEQSMIYTLPGSVKAVKEYLSEITKTMEHLFYMIYHLDVH